jgi:two-component system sensor histidine kinase/response regulator
MARGRIIDEGLGLTPSQCEEVWLSIHRLTSAPAGRHGNGSPRAMGLGLGLFLCRAIMEALGGTAGIESEQGQGSAFWMTVPIHREYLQ